MRTKDTPCGCAAQHSLRHGSPDVPWISIRLPHCCSPLAGTLTMTLTGAELYEVLITGQTCQALPHLILVIVITDSIIQKRKLRPRAVRQHAQAGQREIQVSTAHPSPLRFTLTCGIPSWARRPHRATWTGKLREHSLVCKRRRNGAGSCFVTDSMSILTQPGTPRASRN